jgi:hypothetical protein
LADKIDDHVKIQTTAEVHTLGAIFDTSANSTKEWTWDRRGPNRMGKEEAWALG